MSNIHVSCVVREDVDVAKRDHLLLLLRWAGFPPPMWKRRTDATSAPVPNWPPPAAAMLLGSSLSSLLVTAVRLTSTLMMLQTQQHMAILGRTEHKRASTPPPTTVETSAYFSNFQPLKWCAWYLNVTAENGLEPLERCGPSPHPPPRQKRALFACMRVECSGAGHNADDSGVDGRPKDCDIKSPKTLNIHVTRPSQHSRPKLK